MRSSWRRQVRKRFRSEISVLPFRFSTRTHNSEDLIASLAHIRRLLTAGYSLHSAVIGAMQMSSCPEIEEVHSGIAQGRTIDSVCRVLAGNLQTRRSLTERERDAAITFHVLSLAGTIGGHVGDQLDSLLEILTDRVRLRRERISQAAAAATSMRLLTWLPLVSAGWILFDSPSIRSFLFGSTGGWMCLALGLGTNLLGHLWMKREIAAC